eukprot:1766182-Pyramimonas_sp.AAC.1
MLGEACGWPAGAALGPLGGLLRACWDPPGASYGPLGASWTSESRGLEYFFADSPLGPLLWCSWGLLVPS